jgi:hypothetical protein
VDSGFCTLVSTTQSHCERLTDQDVFIRLDPIGQGGKGVKVAALASCWRRFH